MTGSVFSSAHSFLHSWVLSAIEVGAGVLLGLFYVATVAWVFKDARRRFEAAFLVGLSTLVGVAVPFLGPLIYMLFRPPEYLQDVRERELEIRAMEQRLGRPEEGCEVCGSRVEPDYLVCPVCTTRLRQACGSCMRPLEPSWQLCPYCETPVVDAQVPFPQVPRASSPTRSRSSR